MELLNCIFWRTIEPKELPSTLMWNVSFKIKMNIKMDPAIYIKEYKLFKKLPLSYELLF